MLENVVKSLGTPENNAVQKLSIIIKYPTMQNLKHLIILTTNARTRARTHTHTHTHARTHARTRHTHTHTYLVKSGFVCITQIGPN